MTTIASSKIDKSYLHNQLIRLGDMMGDGMHYEDGGEWIEKEYKKIFHALHPEVRQEQRKALDENIRKFLENKKCSKCSGELEQARKGSKIVYCKTCKARFKCISKKP